nr:ribosomal protein L19 [Cyanidium sp. THAL103]
MYYNNFNKTLIVKTLNNDSSLNYSQTEISVIAGDYIRFGLIINENDKERVQFSEGLVIAKKNKGTNLSLIVRSIFQGIGVERIIFPNSPKIFKLQVLYHSKTRRAKLYYFSTKKGKSAKLKRKFL